jgi:hypothetical protein
MGFDGMARFVLLAVLLVGCPAARAPEAASSGSGGRPEALEDSGTARPFRDLRTWVDEGEGLRLRIPEGWLSRSGVGDGLLLEGRGPEGSGISFAVRSWDGSSESLDGIAADRVGWLSTGPYGHVAEIADEPPWVHSRPAGDDDQELELGWHFVVDGRGFSFIATLPRVGFEAALRACQAVLEGFERANGEPR